LDKPPIKCPCKKHRLEVSVYFSPCLRSNDGTKDISDACECHVIWTVLERVDERFY
jgi:hypothetical protein